MKKWSLIYLCCMMSITLWAQERNAQVMYPQVEIRNDEESVHTFITQLFSKTLFHSNLVLQAKTNSMAATHYLYIQQYDGKEIAGTFLKLSLSNTGKVISIYHDLIETKKCKIVESSNIQRTEIEDESMLSENEIWWSVENNLKSAIKITSRTDEGKIWSRVYTTDGIVETQPLTFYFAQDSLVSGKVFNPDPLTTSGKVYGGSYKDFGGVDTLSLNNERKTKSFKANFDSGIFALKNNRVQLEDLNGDNILPVVSSSPIFDFTREQNGFEDVNSFYHIGGFQSYIKQLGFDCSDTLVRVDPHGTLADNSYFSVPNQLFFGTGGVDDAEDADVLIHEYCHFISYNAAPNTNVGNERNGIDEGICDYFAAAYSKAINSFNWQWVYNWDGHNEFWNGRIVNSTRKYPQDKTGNIYKDGEMWSSTLMQIHDELGRGTTDSLAIETLYQFAPQITYEMAAKALLYSDTLLYNGAHFCTLYKHLFNRGYLPLRPNACGITGIEDIHLTQLSLVNNPNGFSITLEDQNLKIQSYSLYSTLGHKIFESNQLNFSLKSNISPAIYLVEIKTNQGSRTMKWWSGF